MQQKSHKRLYRWLRRLSYSILIAGLLFLLLDFLFPVKTEISFAPLIRDRHGEVLYASLTPDEQWRFRTELSEITPLLQRAVIYKEDRAFWYHPGINPLSVMRALTNNLFHRRRTSGASTITMQVARLLAPKKRSYSNKLLEMFRALQLELHYSKKEILQLYLNLAPYGGNIQGVKAASLLYFQKSPDQLSLAELTALTLIPNRPNALVLGRDNPAIVRERNKWLNRFSAARLFPEQLVADALNEPLAATRNSAPRLAPQFAWRMRRSHPGLLEINTTLDAATQQKTEDLAAHYMAGLKLQGIYNAAAIVVDNQSREVVAYMGSSDFLDSLHHGQVDGVAARRSPGSALKPAAYALAFDRGQMIPQTVVNDVPVNLNGYQPENYDLKFRGRVTVAEALRQSLNIPAIQALEMVGVPDFIAALSRAGFYSLFQQRKKLGLSLILGGCTVRLEEMAGLYSAFANKGNYAPLKFILDSSSHPANTHELFSPSAAYMVSTVLCELQRPDLPQLSRLAQNVPRIAWKTGTSYGRKDAWSIGYNDRYTIAVWIGNFNGKGVPLLSGATTATPLLFQLFHALDKNAASPVWLQAPEALDQRFVCRESGKLPAAFCQDLVAAAYIPGVSRNDICQHQEEVWLSADGSFTYCTTCLPANGYRKELYPRIEPELAAFYASANIPYKKVPPHNPACGRIFEGRAPVILSLTEGASYLIVDKGRQQLTLQASTANDVATVYWYLNDRFFQAAKPGASLFFFPEGGKMKVSCADDKGRVTECRIEVKFL